jgi:MFS transporter, OFA family, oxalate/formate antiporter
VAKIEPKKVLDRRLVVVGALLIQLCLGAIYAWSVFTSYLTDPDGPFGFTSTQTQVIFSVSLATFAIVMVLAGRWQARSGPRIVAMTGGILLGMGYILAGLFGQSFWAQVIFIGLVSGAGIGLAYVCPIAVGVKWFPDKKGLITGLGVAGFGFGALIWVQLAGSWGGLLERFGVLRVFLIYGFIFAIAVNIGSIWMVNPPEGWSLKGWKAPKPVKKGKGKAVVKTDYLPGSMLRTPQFYAIWSMFIFASMAGLMTIGNIQLFSIDALQARAGLTVEQASATAGIAMAVFYSLANGIGRIAWGTISDKIGYKLSLVIMCGAQGVVMLLFYLMGGTVALLYLAALLIGFNYGGSFALFPMATADMFGARNLGLNYGFVFTAYGVGGIVGPILAGALRDAGLRSGAGGLQGWLVVFTICGIACLAAAVIGWFVKPPQTAS